MEHIRAPSGSEQAAPGRLASPTDRRSFLRWSGTAAAAALLAACERNPTEPTGQAALTGSEAQSGSAGEVRIDLSTDVGILNFAYALEQLEAAFYTTAIVDLYSGVSSEEEEILRDIKRHEVVHREFFRTALGDAGIPGLAVNFSAVDFGTRESVLETARAFEDLGVGAYNGAAQFLRNQDFLVVAGKIVSVEARHASAIRDVLGRSFAPHAFDPAFRFEQVLRQAAPFIATKITLVNSPTAGQADIQASQEEKLVS